MRIIRTRVFSILAVFILLLGNTTIPVSAQDTLTSSENEVVNEMSTENNNEETIDITEETTNTEEEIIGENIVPEISTTSEVEEDSEWTRGIAPRSISGLTYLNLGGTKYHDLLVGGTLGDTDILGMSFPQLGANLSTNGSVGGLTLTFYDKDVSLTTPIDSQNVLNFTVCANGTTCTFTSVSPTIGVTATASFVGNGGAVIRQANLATLVVNVSNLPPNKNLRMIVEFSGNSLQHLDYDSWPNSWPTTGTVVATGRTGVTAVYEFGTRLIVTANQTAVSGITGTTAQANATGSPAGGTFNYKAYQSSNNALVSQNATGAYTNLLPSTNYYSAVDYTHSGQTIPANNVNFTTAAMQPTVSGLTVVGTTHNSATLGATFNKGHSSDTEVTKNIAVNGFAAQAVNGANQITQTGLTPNTSYSWQTLYRTNQNGVLLPTVGNLVTAGTTFNTSKLQPTIATHTQTASAATTVTVKATFGNEAPTNTGVAKTITLNGVTTAVNGAGEATFTGLTPNTAYPYTVSYTGNQGNVAPTAISATATGTARTQFNVQESYVDYDGTTALQSLVGGALDKTTAVNNGTTFTPTPAMKYTSGSGVNYIYRGWRESTDAASVIRTTPFPTGINTPKHIYFVYQDINAAFATTADNFTYKLNQANTLVSGGANATIDTVRLANVTTTQTAPGGIPITTVADPTSLATLKTQTTEGIYDLKFNITAHGATISKTVKVFLYDNDNATIGTEYAISSNDFAHSYTTYTDDSNTTLITRADAKIYDLATGIKSTLASDFNITKNGYSATVNTYNINFDVVAELTTSVTTVASVTNAQPVIDFIATPGQIVEVVNLPLGATALTPTDFITGVTLTDADEPTLTTAELIVNGSVDTTTRGIYRITYDYDDELQQISATGGQAATQKVRVYIIGGAIPLPADTYAINATSFQIEKVAIPLTPTQVATYANVQAVNLLTGAIENVTMQGSFDGTNAGVYPITFEIDNDTSKTITIQALVTDGGETENLEKVAVNAHNAYILKSNLAAFQANPAFYANAKGINKVTNTAVTPVADPIQLANITATTPINVAQPLTFTVTEGTQTASVTIQVYVVDALNGNVAWGGHDINIALADINDITLKSGADVTATDMTVPSNPLTVQRTDINVLPHGITNVGLGQPVTFEYITSTYSVDANVFVKYDNVNKEGINAYDFSIKLADVTTPGIFEARSFVAAWDEFGTPLATPSLTSTLPTSIGTTTARFETVKGTFIEVDVTVYEEATEGVNHSIYANSFTIKQADINDTNIMTKSGVVGFDTTTIPATQLTAADIYVITNPLPTTLGTHQVTFGIVGQAETVTVSMRVLADGTEGTNYSIYANPFTIKQADINDTNVMTKSGVVAFDTHSMPSVQIPLAPSSIYVVTNPLPTTLGTHQVTFGIVGQAEEVTVTMQVYANGIDGTNYSIYANPFTINQTDVNDANVLNRSNVVAFDLASMPGVQTPLPQSAIYVVTNPLPTTEGIHQVTFGIVGQVEEVTVDMTVYQQGTLNPGIASIYANDFVIDLASINEANFKANAKVVAYDESTIPATRRPDTAITIETPLPTTEGIHQVTFASHGVEVTVNVQVYSQGTQNPGVASIYANNFAIDLASINEANVKARSGVVAYDDSTIPATLVPSTAITINSTLPTTVGTHDVTFAALGVEVTVKAQVYNSGTVNPGIASIYANDFTIDLASVNEQNFINRSGVVAYDESTVPPTRRPDADIIINSVLPTIEGTHTVTFASYGVEVTVNVQVYDNGTVNPGIASIYANDFTIDLASVNEANVKARSGVVAYDDSTIPATAVPSATITINSVLPTTVGTHDVTFAALGVEVTVKAQVYNSGTVNPGIASIYANNFTIDVASVNETNFIARSGVVAYDESTLPATRRPNTDITIVTPLPTRAGTYQVTFASYGVEVTVNVSVFDSGVVDPGVASIYANNFVLALADVNEANFKTASQVIAFDETTLPVTQVADSEITIISPLPTETGTYDVTFKAQGLENTVEAHIFDTVDLTTNEAMNGIDFTIKIMEIADSDFVDKGQVEAYDISDVNNITKLPKQHISHTNEKPTAPGEMDAEYTTQKGTELKKRVTVIDQIAAYKIKGNNITIKLSTLNHYLEKGTLEKYILEKSESNVTHIITKEILTDLKVDITLLKEIRITEKENEYDILVPITYELKKSENSTNVVFSNEANNTNSEIRTDSIAAKTIVVTVLNDTPYIPGLPITGENIIETVGFGGIITLLSFIILLGIKRRRDIELQK